MDRIFKLLARQNGFSLIEAMLVVGILSFLGVGLSSIIVNVTREQRASQEKLGLLDVKNTLMTAMNNSALCQSQLNQGSPFDLTGSNLNISYNELRIGNTPTSPLIAKVGEPLPGFAPGQMVVSKIQLANMIQIAGVPNAFSADLQVTTDPSTMVHPYKAAQMKILLTVTPSPTLANSIVASCESGAAGISKSQEVNSTEVQFNPTSASCPLGYLLASCMAIVNSSDGQSLFYMNNITFLKNSSGELVGCSSNMTDSNDTYHLHLICVK